MKEMTDRNDPVDAEIVDGPTTAAPSTDLVPVAANTLVVPAAPLEQIAEAFAAYQRLRNSIVTKADLQPIGREGKTFVKKSGWRKMAVAFGVSDEIVREDERFDGHGLIVRCKTVVRAIAPNGRTAEGVGLCHVHERCCPTRTGSKCYDTQKSWHVCCTPETCDGRKHFSKPEHDIPATAHTRAKNRAFSDLFGFGEVSAEELSGLADAPDAAPGDLVNIERAKTVRDRVVTETDDTFKQWAKTSFAWPWNAAACDQIEEALDQRRPAGHGSPQETPLDETGPEGRAVATVDAAALAAPADDTTRKRIFAMCNERGVDDNERHRLIKEATGGRSESSNDLTHPEALSLIGYLKGLPKQ